MPNNRKPKLADGSRWEEQATYPHRTIVEENQMCIWAEPAREFGPSLPVLSMHARDTNLFVVSSDDALAAIRAAKLDPAFDSAVALAEYWDESERVRHLVLTQFPGLAGLLSANSAAVNGATDAV